MNGSLPIIDEFDLPRVGGQVSVPCVMLVGQPNCGKTSLYNRLSGLKGHTANFAGTTVEIAEAFISLKSGKCQLIDLPGIYSLSDGSPEEEITNRVLIGKQPGVPAADMLLVVIDATRLQHQLALAGELRRLELPTVIVLNMLDEVQKRQIQLKIDVLAEELSAPVFAVSTRTGQGMDDLLRYLDKAVLTADTTPKVPALSEGLARCNACRGCPVTAQCSWADDISSRVQTTTAPPPEWLVKADLLLTGTFWGFLTFLVTMSLLFVVVFSVAAYPMEWIDDAFALLAGLIEPAIPGSLWKSFLLDGLLASVGGILVFVPQIFLLFFGINLLEESGYLSRAVVASDRTMRRFGLPGQAFIPMLSAHACAIPAILSTRYIKSFRDRLRTILILPFLSCSARLPVYLMVSTLLFGDSSILAALVLASGYIVGLIAALMFSVLLGRTVVRGVPDSLLIELPPLRKPSLLSALKSASHRSFQFIKRAGGVILVISMILWGASSLPLEDSPSGSLTDSTGFKSSYLAQAGRFAEPIFKPLGFDWQITVGVLSSFAAREAVVSSLSMMASSQESMESEEGLIGPLRNMTRDDGTVLFTVPTALSLLVFFVLALQCFPTQVVTYRETGSLRWPALQFLIMGGIAWLASFAVYHGAKLFL